MDVKQIRLNNLRALIKETGTIAELARRSDTAPAYLSQILNMLPAKSGSPRTIGDRLARKLETANLKPYGWMDRLHEEIAQSGEEGSRVPLFEITDLMRHLSGERISSSRNLTVPFSLSLQAYALHVEGDGMSPRFQSGDIIIADPSQAVASGDFVIALPRQADRPTFAQYQEQNGRVFLSLLNPLYPEIELEGDSQKIDKIIYRGERF